MARPWALPACRLWPVVRAYVRARAATATHKNAGRLSGNVGAHKRTSMLLLLTHVHLALIGEGHRTTRTRTPPRPNRMTLSLRCSTW
eukprot:scaffold22169_cov157-Isochrysis_galbana.AAC.3